MIAALEETRRLVRDVLDDLKNGHSTPGKLAPACIALVRFSLAEVEEVPAAPDPPVRPGYRWADLPVGSEYPPDHGR